MVESARRQKTPNEILSPPARQMTLIFMFATVTLLPFSIYAVDITKTGNPVTITVLVALLSALSDTIGGLLSAIGLAHRAHAAPNVIAVSGRAVEAAGDAECAAPRQDRHDHPREPPSLQFPARPGRTEASSRRRPSPRVARR